MDDYETQFLKFTYVGHKPKTEVWVVISKHTGKPLAEISWHAPWRQYTWTPEPSTPRSNGNNGAGVISRR